MTRTTPSHTQRRALHQGSPPLSVLALAAAACLGSFQAQAQDSYGYIGLGGGQTRAHVDEQRITDSVLTPPVGGFSSYALTQDRRDTAYKVFGGYQFNRYWGLEGGYFNLGKQNFTNTTVPTGHLRADLRTEGLLADVVLTLPITDNFSALARAGATWARTRTQFTTDGAAVLNSTNVSPSERKVNPKLGVGVQYAFSDGLMLRGEAERYRITDAVGGHGNTNLYSVSLVFPFGRTTRAAPRAAYVAPMPEPVVAQAPAPAPMPAPAPVVVVQAPVVVMPAPAPQVVPLRRVSYSAESMFGFDASAVRPEGRAALDTFAAELAGTAYSSITVEGHTDRMGTPEYNLALSQRRAEAVKEYLVRIKGLDEAKVNATGKGETQPSTKPEDCQGKGARAELIGCLQPDRRVEIEVSGTR
jgi:OmpA-OmpF porin, OOP family